MKFSIFLFSLSLVFLIGCKKDNSSTTTLVSGKLSYGDSVFYLKATDYSISPLQAGSGTYSSFPADLNIDESTGRINITLTGKDGLNSQTGIRYRVYFTSTTGAKDSTDITVSGINYQDNIYYLGEDQTVVNPIYNATIEKQIPGATFSSSEEKLAIDPATGEIDLQKTIENSLFHNDPRDDDWEVVTINYRLNDESGGAQNSLAVVLYYYSATENIPENISNVMRIHQDQLLGLSPMSIPVTRAPADRKIEDIVFHSKPRPPCIVIIGR